ncbi:hypothetical protein HPB50_000890 [Hyalomma asiaticum]|uniref:Uncharacterized protein n=1 Tax=Hyalomma asiaticum TaxID=266040 RepID=A0ACB7SAU3_HYAAI|nr:hypothetical protein HPB50_000890 [Hyalomma asiaticum]
MRPAPCAGTDVTLSSLVLAPAQPRPAEGCARGVSRERSSPSRSRLLRAAALFTPVSSLAAALVSAFAANAGLAKQFDVHCLTFALRQSSYDVSREHETAIAHATDRDTKP